MYFQRLDDAIENFCSILGSIVIDFTPMGASNISESPTTEPFESALIQA
jgi:hypothetical protein